MVSDRPSFHRCMKDLIDLKDARIILINQRSILMRNYSPPLTSDIAFQICFLILVSITGPPYLTLWTLYILLVFVLNRLYLGRQEVCSATEEMDRFTRTREHYLRGQAQTELRKVDQAPAPSLVASASKGDVAFDFGFTASDIDLTLGVGSSSSSRLSPPSTAQGGDFRSDQIGIAISDNSKTPQHGHLRVPTPCHVTIRKPNQRGADQDEGIAPVPPIPDNMHIRFTTRDVMKSKRPACSIYSKEWRRRVRKTVTPPEQTACGESAEDSDVKFNNVNGDMATVKPSLDADRLVGAGGSSSLENQSSTVTERQTMGVESMALQTNSPDQDVERNKNKKKKRSLAIGKVLSAFKTLRQRTRSEYYTARDPQQDNIMNVPTPTSSSVAAPTASSASTLSQGSDSQHHNHRLGTALCATVVEKQRRARSQEHPEDGAGSSGLLRGGGNVNSTYPDYICEVEEIHYPMGFFGQRLPRSQRQRSHIEVGIAGEEDDGMSLDSSPPGSPHRRHGRHHGFPGLEPLWRRPRSPPPNPPRTGEWTPPPGTPRNGSPVNIDPFPSPGRRRIQGGPRPGRGWGRPEHQFQGSSNHRRGRRPGRSREREPGDRRHTHRARRPQRQERPQPTRTSTINTTVATHTKEVSNDVEHERATETIQTRSSLSHSLTPGSGPVLRSSLMPGLTSGSTSTPIPTPSMNIARPLGQTPSAAPGKRPLPTAVQVSQVHNTRGAGADTGTDPREQTWSFERLGL
ncbi:hypothetical protein PV04_08891 [Phialophora macrospora]|uniref:Uncharacterized protein n=1 Tax=Phialophora macrospora TaxID=1851006 RepID=A0A0D2DNU7_9EURO|nr:hypothetical protein PV04_08891 [Phialophora macrospora]